MNILKKYMKKNALFFTLGILAMSAGVYMDMFNPIITGRVIDEVIEGGNKEIFAWLAFLLICITIGRAIMGYGKEMFFDYGSIRVNSMLRQHIFDHIQGLSSDFFDSKNTGELMTRIKDDVDHIGEATSFGFMLVLEMTGSLIIATILMFRISWQLSIVAMITLPILAFIGFKLESKIGATYEKISEENAQMNTTAQENITGIRLVKAFAREKYEINKFLKKNKEYYRLNKQQAEIWSGFYPIIELISNILPIIVVVFGGALVIGQDFTIGTLVKFSGYAQMVMWPMRMMGWISNVMAESIASVKRIDTVLKCESNLDLNKTGYMSSKAQGEISFDHVSLELGGSKILDDISFSVKPKGVLAIMGATGSGKSTIINLLTRFYDTSQGSVKIDGIDVKDYQLQNLRQQVSVVMQDVFLFSDTIEENILFGADRELNNHNLLSQCAENAQAASFIDRLDSGYETVIGEKGVGLSGGQKQRLSIARAFAKDAPIIVFDDSTSALDMETEYFIQQALESYEDATKIIVAHRISAVKDADEIIVLENGKIIERGTHEELLTHRGHYFATFTEQYEGYEAVEDILQAEEDRLQKYENVRTISKTPNSNNQNKGNQTALKMEV